MGYYEENEFHPMRPSTDTKNEQKICLTTTRTKKV